MKIYKPVFVKPGDPWIEGMEEVARYGGWTYGGTQQEILDKTLPELETFMETNDYPSSNDAWFKQDCFRDGKMVERETYLFMVPEELFNTVFGPKFNEHGEIAP